LIEIDMAKFQELMDEKENTAGQPVQLFNGRVGGSPEAMREEPHE
jgi:hypothetical protein